MEDKPYRIISRDPKYYSIFKEMKILEYKEIKRKQLIDLPQYLVGLSVIFFAAYYIKQPTALKVALYIIGAIVLFMLTCIYLTLYRDHLLLQQDPVALFYQSPEFLWDDGFFLYTVRYEADRPKKKRHKSSDFIAYAIDFPLEDVYCSDFYTFETKKIQRLMSPLYYHPEFVDIHIDAMTELIIDRVKEDNHLFFESMLPSKVTQYL